MENKIIYTPQFKQWFGDWENGGGSKVVDSNGFPLVVYHGSNAQFDIFDSKFMGQNGTAIGQGFYFTADESYASGYGDNVRGFYLNIKKPLSSNSLTISKKELYLLMDAIDTAQSNQDEDFGYGILSDYGDIDYVGRNNVLKNAVELEYNSSDDDVELIGGLINASGDYNIVTDVLFNKLGYDGIIDEERGLYVIHRSEQAKTINNTKYSNNKNVNENTMKRRVFITESQFEDLILYETEKKFYIEPQKVLIVKKTLDKMFSRGSMDGMGSDGYPTRTNVIGMKSNNGEVVKNMTFEQVLDLLEDKFHNVYTDKEKRSRFLKQVLNDWYNKKISKEGLLSVNTI